MRLTSSRIELLSSILKSSQHSAHTGSKLAGLRTEIARICKIVLVERRLPGRCYQLYFSILNSLGIRFATVKTENGFLVKGYTHCLFMFYEVWSKRDYDISGFTLTKNMTVIDVGANQGFFSLYAASKGATVYALEPCAENFDVLKWNVEKNGLRDQVKMFNTAVASTEGRVTLFVGLDSAGGILSGTVSICNADRGGEGVQTRSVESVSLDSLLRDSHIQRCDLLKMDCEGAEYEILRNTSADSFRKIARISMECHGNRTREAVTILQDAGFEILSEGSGEAALLKATNTRLDG
jgi:FkbM family methyltransferase